MRLKYGIAANLGLVACLSSFMLSLGGEEYGLPILVFCMVIASFFLTDWTKLLRLGDWTSNAILLTIVFMTFGSVIKDRGEGLALSIARVVVFVQIVLLFKEKTPRNCWHILMLSFLQVVVASVFQQNAAYALLLILFVFASLCAFCLIFLYRENLYFQRHTFLHSREESLQTRLALKEQDRGRLLRIIVATLLTGPLAFFLTFNEKKDAADSGDEGNGNDDNRLSSKSSLQKKVATVRSRNVARAVWNAGELWEDGEEQSATPDTALFPETEKGTATGRTFSSIAFPRKFGFSVLGFRKRKRVESVRWPLLNDSPRFSGGTQRDGTIGNQASLYRWLAKWTLFSLVFSAFVFVLFPRYEEVEFFGTSFSYDNWGGQGTALSTVGFTENVRLGSLGNVMQQHREVMSVAFWDGTKYFDGIIEPYGAIEGQTVYYRGIVLLYYERGIWKDRPERNQFGAVDSSTSLDVIRATEDDETPRQAPRQTSRAKRAAPVPHEPVMPEPATDEALDPPQSEAETSDRASDRASDLASDREYFAPQGDRVVVQMVVQPLQTDVLFAPWPCWLIRHPKDQRADSESVLFQFDRLSRTTKKRGVLRFDMGTTAFRDGAQVPLIPNRETAVPLQLLQLPPDAQTKLPTLIELADRWDRESGLPKNDIIGRARFLESKLIHSEQFRYKLGGVNRNLALDPVEDFLSQNPEGHCEYFASALALMLRSIGIGSRVVVGYKTDCVNPADARYSVRQSDAHSWVEAFIPRKSLPNEVIAYDYISRAGGFVFKNPEAGIPPWGRGGWLRLDPTPAASGAEEAHSGFRWADLSSRLREYWNDYVLNMNPSRQTAFVYTPLKRCGYWLATHVLRIDFWKAMVPSVIAAYQKWFDDIRQGHGRFDWTMLLFLPPVILVTILILILRFLYRRLREGFSYRNGKSARNRRGTVEFYRRLEKLLGKAGFRRADAQTQAAFLRECATRLPIPVPLDAVAEAFYRVRFGNQPLDAEELAKIETTINRVAEAIKTKRGKK